MTVSSGFFNSVNHDRLYDAEQLSSIFDGIIIDGVYENYGDAFMVTANPDANSSVIIGTGRAWFDHTWTVNDSQFAMQLDPPNELLGRTDAIVLDIDRTQETRKNSIIYIKGSESSPDLPPSFINEDLHKQYPIAYISRPAGPNSVVSQQNITITVGTSVCRVVTGILDAQNLENLWQQLDDEFNTWWDGIKDTLDENTVTNLQNQIDKINEQLNGDSALVGLLEKNIASSFMSANYGLNAKSYTLSISDYTHNGENVGAAQRCDMNGCSTLLPDGKVFMFYTAFDSNDRVSFIISDLYSKEGSRIQRNVTNVSDTNAYEYMSVVTNNLSASIDVYPVTLQFALSSNNFNSSGRQTCMVVTVQVTSTGEIYVTKGTITEITDHDIFYSALQNDVAGTACKLDDGSYIVCQYCHTTGSTPQNANATAFKITADGTISGAVTTNATYVSTSIFTKRVHNISGVPTIWMGNNYKLTFDPSSLNSSVVSASDSEPNAFTTGELTNYSAKTYSLSEQSGVQVLESVPGTSYYGSETKKSNYFLGASNLDSGLYEGTYLANLNSADQLYGIGTDGTQIAIGSNGGAAILKTKLGSFSSGSFNDIMKYYRGFINNDTNTTYLFCPLMTNSRTYRGVQQKIVILEKG